MYDIVILGGGAAGLMAAINAKNTENSILIVDRNKEFGKKILATGNGRCNFTNSNMNVSNFNSESSSFVDCVLNNFGYEDTICFFKSLGVIPYEKDGYVYPYSNHANSIREVLINRLSQLDIDCLTGVNKVSVEKNTDSFDLIIDKQNFSCKKLVIATGGLSGENFGCSGDGYYFAKKMGHTVIDTYPALVPLTSKDSILQSLAGVRAKANICVLIDDEQVKDLNGEIQFNKDCVSGIPTFCISDVVSKAIKENKKVVCSLNFLPFINKDEAYDFVENIFKSKNSLAGLLPEKLILAIFNKLEISKDYREFDFSSDEIKKIVKELTSLEILIDGTKGYKFSQVTKGGISTNEINPNTMESTIVKSLYFAGEVINVHGVCGGYNLQFAWSSGVIAGKSCGENK